MNCYNKHSSSASFLPSLQEIELHIDVYFISSRQDHLDLDPIVSLLFHTPPQHGRSNQDAIRPVIFPNSFHSSLLMLHSLGKSGLKVSKIILGCMTYGDPNWQPWIMPTEKALPIIKSAFDAGINTWDIADT